MIHVVDYYYPAYSGSFFDATLTLAATQHATLTTHWWYNCLGMPSTIQSRDTGLPINPSISVHCHYLWQLNTRTVTRHKQPMPCMCSSFFWYHLNLCGDSTCHTDHTLTVSRNALNHPIVQYGGPPIYLPIPSHYPWCMTTQCLWPRVQPGVCPLLQPSQYAYISPILLILIQVIDPWVLFWCHTTQPNSSMLFFPKFFFLLYLSFDVVITCMTVPVCCATVYIIFHQSY